MNPGTADESIRRSLGLLLQPARQHLRASVIRSSAGRAGVIAIWTLGTCCALEALAHWTLRDRAGDVPGIVHVIAVGVGATAACIIGVKLARARKRADLAWLEVAQRLDAACDTDNRIATSWSLAETGDRTDFALAAMHQGLLKLQSAGTTEPLHLGKEVLHWRRLALASGVVLAAGLLVSRPLLLNHAGAGSRTVNLPEAASMAVSTTATAPADRDAPALALAAGEMKNTSNVKAAAQNESVAGPREADERRGNSKKQTPAVGSRGGQTGRTGAEAAGKNDASSSSGAPASTRKQGRQTEAQSHSESSGSGDSASSGSISGGGAGRGRAVPVKNQGLQRESPTSSELEASGDDAPIDEEQTGNQQRGGVQPALPDRTEAPSRELGITGPQSGKPGTGRGGPSPAKKARGAASLLMGVPIPDFVKGKAGPGATAVTMEETPPVTSPGQSGPAAPARPRSEPESIVPRYEIPWSEAEIVEQYSRRWQRRTVPAEVTAQPQQAGTAGDSLDANRASQGATRP